MSKIKVKLNKAGIIRLLQSQDMMDAVKNEALKHGKIDTTFVGFDRVQVIVKKENDNAN